MQRSFVRLASQALRRTFASAPSTAEIVDGAPLREVAKSISSEVNEQFKRLFAVVYVNGRQWKVGQGDLIVLEGNLPLSIGDEINLDKVLMVGSSQFTVFGRPMLDKKSVTVTATVVEKSTKSPEVRYVKHNHHQTRSLNWLTTESTMLRITEVSAKPGLVGSNGVESQA